MCVMTEAYLSATTAKTPPISSIKSYNCPCQVFVSLQCTVHVQETRCYSVSIYANYDYICKQYVCWKKASSSPWDIEDMQKTRISGYNMNAQE